MTPKEARELPYDDFCKRLAEMAPHRLRQLLEAMTGQPSRASPAHIKERLRGLKRGEESWVHISTTFPRELGERVQDAAALLEMSIADLMREAIAGWLEAQGNAPLAVEVRKAVRRNSGGRTGGTAREATLGCFLAPGLGSRIKAALAGKKRRVLREALAAYLEGRGMPELADAIRLAAKATACAHIPGRSSDPRANQGTWS